MMGMTMKMAAVSEITLLLLCCSVITSTDSQGALCDSYAATGDNFTVLLTYNLKDTEKLKWSREQTQIVERKPLKNNGRVIDQKLVAESNYDIYQNGSLKLTKLNRSHTGSYMPRVYRDDGTSVADFKSLRLCVLDRVPEPEVMTVCDQATVRFTCKVVQTKDLKFTWLQNDQVLKGKNGLHLMQEAKIVEKNSFSCKVSNQVSSLTSAPVKDPCHQSGFVFPYEVMGLSIWIFVGGGGGVVLVLIIVVIVCCVQAKRKKRMLIKDEEEFRLGLTYPDQQQPRPCPQHGQPPGRQHQQQPAGHTGPRQHRPKQPREHPRSRAQDPHTGEPQPSPRRPAQTTRPLVNENDEKPPPLPQPRRIVPRV